MDAEQARALDLEPGEYLALLTHSGSRGTGAQVCDFYSKRAMARHEHLPKVLKHLAWLSLDDADGQEYWAAMNLMGRYAAANHALIHKHIAKKLGAQHVILDIENHHNFAWKERHVVNGEEREVIVHRKGATPAGAGVLGIIPGSMASPGYVVRDKGSPESLHSASPGAGRVMSRTKAMQSFTWSATKKLLAERSVELLSAGLDEVPGVYKDIHAVMAAQTDLVEVIGQFDLKLVKCARQATAPKTERSFALSQNELTDVVPAGRRARRNCRGSSIRECRSSRRRFSARSARLGGRHPAPSTAAIIRTACAAARTLWTRKIAAPRSMPCTMQATVPASRSAGFGRPSTSPMTVLRETGRRMGRSKRARRSSSR